MYSNISQILLQYKTWWYYKKFDSTKSLGWGVGVVVVGGEGVGVVGERRGEGRGGGTLLTCVKKGAWIKRHLRFMLKNIPYLEPVYTGWSSVHWNATGWPSVHWDTTGRPSGCLQGTLEHHWKKLSWNSPTLECHWRNLIESAPRWDATGETLTFAAYTGTPLEGLWQPTHAPTYIVTHAE